jgi:cobyrinic acid a,c-diamide synthase
MITRQTVADKIGAWLRHEVALDELVDWAERALQDEDFDPSAVTELTEVVGRLGLADVRAFGLNWEDCEDLLQRLGYKAHVEITVA